VDSVVYLCHFLLVPRTSPFITLILNRIIISEGGLCCVVPRQIVVYSCHLAQVCFVTLVRHVSLETIVYY